MLFRRFLATSLTVFLAVGSAAAATKKKPAGKTVSATKSRSKATSSKAKRSARARRSSPARQMQPTAERYSEIQQALVDRGYYDGAVDGVWDSDCVNALKRFQEDQNLSPDGKLGALSLIALGLGPKREPISEFSAKPEAVEEQ